MQNEFHDTDQLADLVGKKLSVLQQLRDKSRQQADLIQRQEMDRLMSVLGAKQILVNELQKLERLLDPFRAQDPEQRRWRTSEFRIETRRKAEQCDAMLQEALLLDKQSESLLKHRRDEAATRLEGIHDASHASRAYGQARDAGGGKQLDISS